MARATHSRWRKRTRTSRGGKVLEQFWARVVRPALPHHTPSTGVWLSIWGAQPNQRSYLINEHSPFGGFTAACSGRGGQAGLAMARACRGAHKCLPSATTVAPTERAWPQSKYIPGASQPYSLGLPQSCAHVHEAEAGAREEGEERPRGGREGGLVGPYAAGSTQHRVRRWALTVMPGRISRGTGRGTLVQRPGWLRGLQARSRTLSAGLLQSIDHSTPTSPLSHRQPYPTTPIRRASRASSHEHMRPRAHQSFRFSRVLAGGLKGWRSSDWRRATTERGSVVVPQSTFLGRTGGPSPSCQCDPPLLISDPCWSPNAERRFLGHALPGSVPPSIGLP